MIHVSFWSKLMHKVGFIFFNILIYFTIVSYSYHFITTRSVGILQVCFFSFPSFTSYQAYFLRYITNLKSLWISKKKGIKKPIFKCQLKSNYIMRYICKQGWVLRCEKKARWEPPTSLHESGCLRLDAVPQDNLCQTLRHKPSKISKTIFTTYFSSKILNCKALGHKNETSIIITAAKKIYNLYLIAIMHSQYHSP